MLDSEEAIIEDIEQMVDGSYTAKVGIYVSVMIEGVEYKGERLPLRIRLKRVKQPQSDIVR